MKGLPKATPTIEASKLENHNTKGCTGNDQTRAAEEEHDHNILREGTWG